MLGTLQPCLHSTVHNTKTVITTDNRGSMSSKSLVSTYKSTWHYCPKDQHQQSHKELHVSSLPWQLVAIFFLFLGGDSVLWWGCHFGNFVFLILSIFSKTGRFYKSQDTNLPQHSVIHYLRMVTSYGTCWFVLSMQ
jgi:hypothetical protein